jgi:hypothetical protein
MTAILEKAFAQASSLPAANQKQMAEQLVEYIKRETQWDQTLTDSQKFLETLAARARQHKLKGKTVSKGIDEL